MYKLLDTVALTHDIPSAELRCGDVGSVVEILGSEAIEVEFVTASGRTQSLLTLGTDDVRQLVARDMVTVRSLDERDS